jgi:ParB-like chromosome segregation protein Spo0J
MQIEKLKTELLIPADYNPRKDLKPGDPEYEKLKRSIEQFGYVEPVIWNKTTSHVVGGHQRLKVLLDLGLTKSSVCGYRNRRGKKKRHSISPSIK